MILWSSFEENSSPKNGKRINSVLGYSWNLAIFKAVKSGRHLSWRPPYTSQLFYMVAYFERQVRVNQRVVDRYKPSGNTITVEITFSVLLHWYCSFGHFFPFPSGLHYWEFPEWFFRTFEDSLNLEDSIHQTWSKKGSRCLEYPPVKILVLPFEFQISN